MSGPDIFFSYAREDSERVGFLVGALRARGWSVFWDRRIPAGQTWRSHIGRALDEARCVVVAWSHNSVASKWVLEEADEGLEREVLVPILLEPVRPPRGFRGIQAADLSAWSPDRASEDFDSFIADLATVLGTATNEPVAPLAVSGPSCEGDAGDTVAVSEPGPASGNGAANTPAISRTGPPTGREAQQPAEDGLSAESGAVTRMVERRIEPIAEAADRARGAYRRWLVAALFLGACVAGGYLYFNAQLDLRLMTLGPGSAQIGEMTERTEAAPPSADNAPDEVLGPQKVMDPAPRDLEGARAAKYSSTEPASPHSDIEAALGLGPDEWQGIQRDLTLLGFDTHGRDGIPGTNTRVAIAAWQESKQQQSTGYLSGWQRDLIVDDALQKLVGQKAAPPRPTSDPVTAGDVPPQMAVAASAQPAHPAQTAAAPPNRRLALVIGNSAYQHVPSLANPRRDAEAMAKALAGIGFEVFQGVDLDRDAMDNLTATFARRAAQAEIVFAYYSGQGLEVDGRNYLLPVDARLEDRLDLRRLVVLDQIIEDASQASKFAIVVLDACRDNPLDTLPASRTGSPLGLSGKSLAHPGFVPPQTLIAYAAAAGDVAYDGTGENSPFTTALLRNLDIPGLEVRQMFGNVADEVRRETGGAQAPGFYSTLSGDPAFLVKMKTDDESPVKLDASDRG